MTDEESIHALKERVKDGNQKLNEAWSQICQIPSNTEQWNKEFEKWHLANEKLSAMCTQLQTLGYRDCLYIISWGPDNKLTEEQEREIMTKIASGEYIEVGENKVKTKKCLGEKMGCRVCPSARSYWEEELMKLPSPSSEKEPSEPKPSEPKQGEFSEI